MSFAFARAGPGRCNDAAVFCDIRIYRNQICNEILQDYGSF
jgi:hypothetical protein